MTKEIEENKLINSVCSVMEQCVLFIDGVDLEQYQDKSHLPFKSSIGEHCRHVIEIFEAAFKVFDPRSNFVDFSFRERKIKLSEDPVYAKQFLLDLKAILLSQKELNLSRITLVKDDLGHGELCQESTVGSCLLFACSHAIHHYAQLKTMAFNLGISLDENRDFGFNPTTPR